jgi:hypothetical protein
MTESKLDSYGAAQRVSIDVQESSIYVPLVNEIIPRRFRVFVDTRLRRKRACTLAVAAVVDEKNGTA